MGIISPWNYPFSIAYSEVIKGLISGNMVILKTASETQMVGLALKKTVDSDTVFSDGIAIGSILHTDEHSHLEPVRYASGSEFWRLLLAPMVSGSNLFIRLSKLAYNLFRYPVKNLKVVTVWDFAKRTQILLFMQTLNSTLKLLSMKRMSPGFKSSLLLPGVAGKQSLFAQISYRFSDIIIPTYIPTF